MKLVLLPGMDGTGELFAPLIDALPPGTDVRVVSYPVDDVLEYADLRPIAQAAIPASGDYLLVGESFSGPLAITLASRGDPRLKGLVICCSYVRAPLPRPLRFLPHLAWPGLIRRASRSRALIRLSLVGWGCPSDVVAAVAAVLERSNAAVLVRRFEQIFEVDVTASLASIDVPMLYLAGRYDRIVGMEGLDQIAAQVPGLLIAVLDAPHLALQVRPREAVRAIRDFSERNCPARD